MGCCRGPTRFEFVRQTRRDGRDGRTDGLLADTKKKRKKKKFCIATLVFFFSGFPTSRVESVLAFSIFSFRLHWFLFLFLFLSISYPYHIPILHYYSFLFFSFIYPLLRFRVFLSRDTKSPSLRHMGPGVLMTCSMSRPTYLPILSESLFHLPVLLRAVTVLFTIPILPVSLPAQSLSR